MFWGAKKILKIFLDIIASPQELSPQNGRYTPLLCFHFAFCKSTKAKKSSQVICQNSFKITILESS